MKFRFVPFYLLLYLPFLLCAAETPYETECNRLAGESGKDSERLQQFFKMDWQHTMIESPEFATDVGYPGQNDRWTDQTLEAIERRQR